MTKTATRMMNRITLTAAVLLAVPGSLAEDTSVHVYNWTDYIDKQILHVQQPGTSYTPFHFWAVRQRTHGPANWRTAARNGMRTRPKQRSLHRDNSTGGMP
ncbi:MAG: hypothetical protein OXU75_02305 [Deltaproteobacteria bacterium]|nr:hypothetical protein [Deltaproteobacteria bacterium]